METISQLSDSSKFKNKRHALALIVFRQIADGTAKDPRAATLAYVENYPQWQKDAPETLQSGTKV